MAYSMKGSTMYGKTCKCNSDSNSAFKQSLTGENTGEIKKDKKGEDYALVLENTLNHSQGDTIRPGNAPRVGDYIMGGDYTAKKTGNKNYEITGDAK
jgi:hypothetical protein